VAGNSRTFEEAMQAATNAAWDQDWSQAISAYQQALAESPQDVGALTGLGWAYFGTGQVDAALETYQQAAAQDTSDPVLFERMGLAQEKLGQGQAASQSYLAAAERYQGQQATDLALARWQDAVRAWPDSVQARAQLLQHYQRSGQIQDAVQECLALARIYHAHDKTKEAMQICEHALKLAPHDPEVLATLDTIRRGEKDAPELEAPAVSEDEAPAALGAGADISLDFDTPDVEVQDRGSPVELTRQKALTDLAESFFEEAPAEPTTSRLSKAEIDGLIGKAIEFQTLGQIEDAINAYEQVLRSGADQPAVSFNLGLLYQEKLRFDAAISQLERAVSNPEYRLGSYFALGECYRAKGRVDEALENFVEVLKIVDMATVKREQADDLIQLYEHLADGYVAKGDRDQALEFTNSLVTFLSEQGWEDKIVKARRRLDVLAEEGGTLSLAEMLAIPEAESILESVALAQEYTKRGMYYTALEECYNALRQAPTYLPTHRQLAQVLLTMGKVEEAVAKLVSVASTYLSHGNVRQAVAMYKRALKLSPMNTGVRTKLIDMLLSHGQIEQALEHYLILADSYYNLAQIDQARDIYQEALKLAPRTDPARRWEVRILHKIGDIDMQRIDWKRAFSTYDRIRRIAPDDERARLQLMGLQYRMNRPDLAITELDELLNYYHENKMDQRIVAVLEDAVNERPEDIPLRTRLAQHHLNTGNAEEALKHLDKLGDLQLNSGRPGDARATIRAIIALNPPNVEAYQQLLEQISERGPE